MINGFNEKYAFLSMYYPSQLTYDNITYNCLATAFLGNLVTDITQKKMIAKSAPSRATIMVVNSDEKKNLSEEKQLELMYELCKIKFSDESLKKELLNTNNEELVNFTTWNNTFWGITNGEGKNHLGKILMRIRDEFTSNVEKDVHENVSDETPSKKKKKRK